MEERGREEQHFHPKYPELLVSCDERHESKFCRDELILSLLQSGTKSQSLYICTKLTCLNCFPAVCPHRKWFVLSFCCWSLVPSVWLITQWKKYTTTVETCTARCGGWNAPSLCPLHSHSCIPLHITVTISARTPDSLKSTLQFLPQY